VVSRPEYHRSGFDASTFSKNKERLLENEVARKFLVVVLEEARQRKLLSEDHFTVDGTLLEAWASLKSFSPKGGNDTHAPDEKNPSVDFTGKNGRMTHTIDDGSQGALGQERTWKGSQTMLYWPRAHGERNGMVVDVTLTPATGTAEREAALDMLRKYPVASCDVGCR